MRIPWHTILVLATTSFLSLGAAAQDNAAQPFVLSGDPEGAVGWTAYDSGVLTTQAADNIMATALNQENVVVTYRFRLEGQARVSHQVILAAATAFFIDDTGAQQVSVLTLDLQDLAIDFLTENFEAIDTSGDGIISMPEFEAVVVSVQIIVPLHLKQLPASPVLIAWNQTLDLNQDGGLDRPELDAARDRALNLDTVMSGCGENAGPSPVTHAGNAALALITLAALATRRPRTASQQIH